LPGDGIYRISAAVRYLVSAQSRYRIHSPFLFAFLDEGLRRPLPRNAVQRTQAYRKSLTDNNTVIDTAGYGAGSRVFTSQRRTVSRIAKVAGMNRRKIRLMQKTVRYFKPKEILELGTSLGIGSVAMATAAESRVTSIEGCPVTADMARKHIRSAGIPRIEIITGSFEETLPRLLEDKAFDMYYLDGNHTREATLKYFEIILPQMENHTIVIMDDIHWSKGMNTAWQTVAAHPEVTLSLDFYDLGMLFFRKELTKEHKSILFI